MELDIVRAWKDAQYRQSLSAEQQAMLPENPVGNFELTEAELDAVNGGSLGALGAGLLGGDSHEDSHSEEPHSRGLTGNVVFPNYSTSLLGLALLTSTPSQVTTPLTLTCP